MLCTVGVDVMKLCAELLEITVENTHNFMVQLYCGAAGSFERTCVHAYMFIYIG